MTARYTTVRLAPKVVRCSECSRPCNRLAVYRAHDGRIGLCTACVNASNAPKGVSIMQYGQCPTILPDGSQCQRYAMHKGEHRATMTRKGKPQKVAA